MHDYDSRRASAAPASEPKPEAPAAPPPPAIPEALRPFAPELEDFGEDEDEDAFAASLDFPFAAAQAVSPAVADRVHESEDEPVEEFDATGYGSLLAMAGTPRPFDAPPEAERQAAQPRARLDPAETERALRSALATLQRMSGAA
jgi:hypothetical protein